jgi:hypothetical protein
MIMSVVILMFEWAIACNRVLVGLCVVMMWHQVVPQISREANQKQASYEFTKAHFLPR